MRRHLVHAVIIMTAQGHLLFSVTCTLIAHKLQLTPALADASLWQTIPAALASALLPDLDHPKSVLGQRLPWISKPLRRACSVPSLSTTSLMRLSRLRVACPLSPINSQ